MAYWQACRLAGGVLVAILLATLILHRTDALLPSPWQTLSPWFFILFAISTILLE